MIALGTYKVFMADSVETIFHTEIESKNDNEPNKLEMIMKTMLCDNSKRGTTILVLFN